MAVILGLSGVTLAGCGAETENIVPGDPAALSPSSFTKTFQAGDKLRVTVFGEDKLTGEFELDPSGVLTLPLIGPIKAAGRSQDQLTRDLEAKLEAAAYREPKVTIEILSFRPIYVLGEVQKPGDYPFNSGLTVLRAIALAGGQTYRASEKTVVIQHAGDPQMRSYPLDANVPVYPGDLIRLPERYF